MIFSDELIAGKTYNAGYENHTVAELAEKVRTVVEREVPGREQVEIVRTPSDDPRSYHISSRKIEQHLGYVPKRSIQDAVRDLCQAFRAGRLPDSLADDRYFNVRAISRGGWR